MVDIHSATAEIRRGKKERIKKEETRKKPDKNIMSASATQGGHKNNHCWLKCNLLSLRLKQATVEDTTM